MIPVSDWMTKSVLTVDITDSIGHARRIMAEQRINQLPVLDDGRLVGIVTDRDVRDAYPTSLVIDRFKEIDSFADTYTVEEVMSYNVIFVRPRTPLSTAVKLLRRHRIGALPVVERGKLAGILTRSNILAFVLSGESLELVPSRKRRRSTTPRRVRLGNGAGQKKKFYSRKKFR
jgi:acetoin utilization protein AcuB